MTYLAALPVVSLTSYPADCLRTSLLRAGKAWGFTWLQAFKWACHKRMDASRRHETPGSETNDLVTWDSEAAWALLSWQFPLPLPHKSPGDDTAGSDGHSLSNGLLRDPVLRKPQSFIMGSSKFTHHLPPRATLFLLYWTAIKLAPCFWREILSLSSKAVLYSDTLERIVCNRTCLCFCL